MTPGHWCVARELLNAVARAGVIELGIGARAHGVCFVLRAAGSIGVRRSEPGLLDRFRFASEKCPSVGRRGLRTNLGQRVLVHVRCAFTRNINPGPGCCGCCGLACDAIGNLFVTSTTTVRLLAANANMSVDRTGSVQTIYGAPPRDTFPSSVTACLTGLAIVDDTRIQVVDSCTGLLVELAREAAPTP